MSLWGDTRTQQRDLVYVTAASLTQLNPAQTERISKLCHIFGRPSPLKDTACKDVTFRELHATVGRSTSNETVCGEYTASIFILSSHPSNTWNDDVLGGSLSNAPVYQRRACVVNKVASLQLRDYTSNTRRTTVKNIMYPWTNSQQPTCNLSDISCCSICNLSLFTCDRWIREPKDLRAATPGCTSLS